MKLLKCMWKCWLAQIGALVLLTISIIGAIASFWLSLEAVNGIGMFVMGFGYVFLVLIALLLQMMADDWEEKLEKEYEETLDEKAKL